ncbi:uncharacterized protein N7503_003900 [Penicillium pulvis]|uniref:uncharacterized protein n=1 Tax=Penicillium pulvis TaxID=1562058 RepID=UPI0025482BC2|nr:uncharacterized protein N7503_003900 [Penicillium pulvis]KAJ5806298.1 hypothetical protein N7503_003900 [Penicillium pulvis]
MSFTQAFVLVPDKTLVRRPKAHKVTLMVTSVRLRSSLALPSRLPIVITRPLIAEIGVRFSDLRKGSRVPISTQAQRHLPVALKPVAQLPSIAKSISQLPKPLVERREARQGRSRPWIQPLKQVAPRRTQIQTLLVVAGRKVLPAGVIGLERSVAATLARGRPVKSALGIAPPKSRPVSVARVVVADVKNLEMKGPFLTDNSGEAVVSLSKKHVSFGDVNVSEVPRWIKLEFVYSPGHIAISDTLGYRGTELALLLPKYCSEDASGCGLQNSRRLSAMNAHIEGQCASNGDCSWHWVATHRRYFPDEPPEDSFQLMSNIRRNISGV